MISFNLLYEPWLDVVATSGLERVSLVDLFERSREIKSLTTRLPAARAAIFRQVVLAGYLDMLGVPQSIEEWKTRWGDGQIDPYRIHRWADEVHDRFDLFDPVAPFAQSAGLVAVSGEVKPAAVLDPREATGNNVPLFSARSEADSRSYSPAEAAELLLHALAFDPAGIKTGAQGDPNVKGGKLYGNPTGPLGRLGVVIPLGQSLYETILLNCPIIPDGLPASDIPHWRRPPSGATWATREPSGPLDWLTLLSRRVRLIAEERGAGIEVVAAVVAGGDRWTAPDPAFELHSAWRVVEDPGPDDPHRRPKRHRSDKAAWEGLPSLIALGAEVSRMTETSVLLRQAGELVAAEVLDSAYPMSALVAGYEYGPQSAVFENVVYDELPIPTAALRVDQRVGETITAIVSCAEDLVMALNGFDADLRRACGGEPTPWDRGQRPGIALVQQFDPIVRRILAGLRASPDLAERAEVAWCVLATAETRSLAKGLLSACPPDSFAGRSIEVNGKERTYRVATAELTFQRRIKDAVAKNFPLLEATRNMEATA